MIEELTKLFTANIDELIAYYQRGFNIVFIVCAVLGVVALVCLIVYLIDEYSEWPACIGWISAGIGMIIFIITILFYIQFKAQPEIFILGDLLP